MRRWNGWGDDATTMNLGEGARAMLEAGADTLKAMQDEYGERVWNDAIPNDTRICSVDALTRSSPAAQYPGRGLSAYRRALDWLLLTEARDTEQAA